MGDSGDKGLDMEEFGTELVLGIFAVFLIFEYSLPSSSVYGALFSLVSILAVLMLIKGTYDIVIKSKTMTFWTGAAIAMVLILFFNGMGSILSAVNLVFVAVEEFFGIILGF